MMDTYLYDDVRRQVEKKCKKLYKKGFWDRSWLKKVHPIMNKSFSQIQEFLKD